jgi:hypothetical protein
LLDLVTHALWDQYDAANAALRLLCTESHFISDLSICAQDITDAQRSNFTHSHPSLMRQQKHTTIAARMPARCDVQQTLLDVSLVKYSCL